MRICSITCYADTEAIGDNDEMTLRPRAGFSSKLWLGLALTLYWPAAYFAIYVPLIVPHEAWQAAHASLWILACGYAVCLCIMGALARLDEVLLASLAITISVALFTSFAGLASLPAFRKGPDGLSEALVFALPLGLLAAIVIFVAKGLIGILKSRARAHAA